MSYETQTIVVTSVFVILIAITRAIRKSPRFNRVRGSGNPYYDNDNDPGEPS